MKLHCCLFRYKFLSKLMFVFSFVSVLAYVKNERCINDVLRLHFSLWSLIVACTDVTISAILFCAVSETHFPM